MDKIWQREKRRQDAEQWRKDRMRRNWPIHKQIAVRVLNQFKEAARKDGVRYVVQAGQASGSKRMHEFIGQDEISLYTPVVTAGKEVTRSEGPRHIAEHRGGLVIQYNEWRGLIQALYIYPRLTTDKEPRVGHNHDIMLFRTYNPDDLTKTRIEKLVRQTLTINRVVSVVTHASWSEVRWHRYWKYMDDRNHKGIGGRDFKLFRPFTIGVFGAIYLAVTLWSAIASLW